MNKSYILAAVIAAAALALGSADPAELGTAVAADRWWEGFGAVAGEGFMLLDLTDSWIPVGSLPIADVRVLHDCATDAGVAITAISAIRRSVLDRTSGAKNITYSHRCIDVAAELGAGVVSVGLHQPLTPAQASRLWFWTAEGHRDDPADREGWADAVRAFRELGRHARDVGVLLSLEMYEDTFLGSAESAVRLVEEIADRSVGLNPDIGNLIRRPGPIEPWGETLRAVLPYTNFWHVKNYSRYEDPSAGLHFALPSYLESGLINYRQAMDWAIHAGFRGVISVEHYGGDGLSMSAANRDYLRRRAIPGGEVEFGVSRVQQAAAWGGGR